LTSVVLALGCSSDSTDGDDGGTAPTAESNQWTMLGHDLGSSYRNSSEDKITVENAGSLQEFWKFQAGGQVTGAPAVVDGVVYVNSAGGVHALDADTGAVLWEVLSIHASSSPTYSE